MTFFNFFSSGSTLSVPDSTFSLTFLSPMSSPFLVPPLWFLWKYDSMLFIFHRQKTFPKTFPLRSSIPTTTDNTAHVHTEIAPPSSRRVYCIYLPPDSAVDRSGTAGETTSPLVHTHTHRFGRAHKATINLSSMPAIVTARIHRKSWKI